jgi:adenylate kinase family enzyme
MAKRKVYRIGIVGSAGVGKSSLGLALSEKLGIPFLCSKDVTLDILKSEGYDYSSGVQVERFLAQGGRQDKIFKRTIDAESSNPSFVSDRTVIDLMAYSIAELYYSDPQKVGKCFEQYAEHTNRYTHLFFCAWGQKPLIDNKVRTLNPWYQFIIHSLELGILEVWNLDYHVLDATDDDGRVKEITEILAL